ncbi:MAG: methyltransferase domain-containing protein [Synechococcales cyanobacterium RM1_1_8]|nr:methyltransferase domain-containing protein [Synechococcales cyanobacterium RM1_1_8]
MTAPLPIGPSDPSFWAEKYQGNYRPPWDLGQAAPPLKGFLDRHPELRPGKTAVVGSGLGNDALLFAQRGFEVVGFDFVAAAIAAAHQAAVQADLPATFLQRDVFLLGEEFPQQFDYVVEHTCYCAIDPARRDDYVRSVHGILKPGGQFIGLFRCDAKTNGPPFGSDPEVLQRRFSGQAEGPFERLSFGLAPDSVAARQGKEYLGWFRKAA